MFRKFIRNQSGFSLIQVLIGFALLGALSVFMMQIFEQQGKLTNKVKSDSEITEINYHFLNMLNDKIACNANLGNKTKGDAIKNFRIDEGGEPFAVVGERFKNSGIMIEEMKILTDAEVTASGGKIIPIRESDGFTQVVFRVKFKRLNANIIGGKTITKDFNVSVKMGQLNWNKGAFPREAKDDCHERTPAGYKVANYDFDVTTQSDDPNNPYPCELGAMCFVPCVGFGQNLPELEILNCVTPGN